MFYFKRDNSTLEEDFFIRAASNFVPIEAKAGVNTKAKSLDIFRNKYGIEKFIRVSAKKFGYANGIKSVPLYAVWCITR